MEQRLSLITLGVANLSRARSFYETLGWTSGADGHPWEVAHNPHWTLHDDDSISLW